MIIAAALLAYAMVLSRLFKSRALPSPVLRQHPVAGLLVAHSCALSCLIAVGAALSLTAHDVSEHTFMVLFDAAKPALHEAYTLGLPVRSWQNTAALLPITAVLYALWSAVAAARSTRVQQRLHQRLHLATSTVRIAEDVDLVHHSERLVYCLPGRARRIIVTSAAWTSLGDRGMAAAVAHERAHLARRHHGHARAAALVGSMLAPTRLMRSYRASVAIWCEMDADDRAARATSASCVARALLDIGSGGRPTVPRQALSAGGTATAARVRRLLDHSVSLPHRPRVLGTTALAGGVLVLWTLPLALFLMPAALLYGSAQ